MHFGVTLTIPTQSSHTARALGSACIDRVMSYFGRMVIGGTLESQLLALPERDRADLASLLLSTLPPSGTEGDGVEEALRREAELEADPSLGLTLTEFEQEFHDYKIA